LNKDVTENYVFHFFFTFSSNLFSNLNKGHPPVGERVTPTGTDIFF
jgi:hypothetical protein